MYPMQIRGLKIINTESAVNEMYTLTPTQIYCSTAFRISTNVKITRQTRGFSALMLVVA